MPRSEALKEAQKRYRAKQDKYENIKRINTKSNKKKLLRKKFNGSRQKIYKSTCKGYV